MSTRSAIFIPAGWLDHYKNSTLGPGKQRPRQYNQLRPRRTPQYDESYHLVVGRGLRRKLSNYYGRGTSTSNVMSATLEIANDRGRISRTTYNRAVPLCVCIYIYIPVDPADITGRTIACLRRRVETLVGKRAFRFNVRARFT